jgi:16S rRNA (cytidine1402-2'-O)-methyltransferase
MTAHGALHLIPVGLGDAPIDCWLPAGAQEQVRKLTIYIAENAKTARAFLKQAGTPHPLQSITIHTLDARTSAEDIRAWLAPAQQGQDIGLVSEAGCPAVADPGALVAAQAHRMGIPVRPWTGPSSILLALMASGLDGQRFAFHGYAPVEPGERAKRLKLWEAESRKLRQTQLFIETPYRNNAMFKALTQTLHGRTRLCVARALTTADEWIGTRAIEQWKTQPPPDLDKKPAMFLFLSE